jgi:hypothetical protein
MFITLLSPQQGSSLSTWCCYTVSGGLPTCVLRGLQKWLNGWVLSLLPYPGLVSSPAPQTRTRTYYRSYKIKNDQFRLSSNSTTSATDLMNTRLTVLHLHGRHNSSYISYRCTRRPLLRDNGQNVVTMCSSTFKIAAARISNLKS